MARNHWGFCEVPKTPVEVVEGCTEDPVVPNAMTLPRGSASVGLAEGGRDIQTKGKTFTWVRQPGAT